MKTDSSLTQLLSAHSFKHPPSLIVSLLEKITGIPFLAFPFFFSLFLFLFLFFFSFSFIEENGQPRAVANLPCNIIKSNTSIYPKDTFRNNVKIKKYPTFTLVSFNDL